jgi:hypothetical protein
MAVPSPTRLRQSLADTLLVQTDAAHCMDAAECSDRVGGGLVLTGDKALSAAQYLLDIKGYDRPILLDRGRYAGNGRTFAGSAFDTNWISRQRKLNLAAIMPDAGYVGEGDEPGLVSILTRAADMGEGVVATLGLHLSWLDAKRGLGTLIEQVGQAGVPVAIALEHQKDPLAKLYALDGLVELLAQPVPVILLRCDVSAIGALCFGALAAAVGTSTGLRHIYPLPKKDANGGGTAAKTAAVVRGCLAYVQLDKIDLAIQADPDNVLWECDCRVCNGQSLDWLGSAPVPESASYLHSLETLYRIRNDLLGNAATQAERRAAWIAQCDSAVFQHLDINKWEPPQALCNWTRRGERELTRRPTR